MTTFDTSTLRTLEDAVDAIYEINWDNDADADAEAHMLAEWIWNNCDHNNDEVAFEVYIWSEENSELESLAYKAYYGE